MKDITQAQQLVDTSRLIRGGAWRELAASLGFYTDSGALIPPGAYKLWGLKAADMGSFSGLKLLAATRDFRLLQVDDRGDGDFSSLRRLIHQAWRHNPEVTILWWWTRPDALVVLMGAEQASGRFFVRRMDLARDSPDPVNLAQLRALDIHQIAASDLKDGASSLKRHFGEVLEQQRMTREFFLGFRRALKTLSAAMEGGPADPEARHDIALSTLLRLVFLYFLQARGALDADPRFVLRHLREARAAQVDFYQRVLRPLFFGALNRPRDARDAQVAELGDLPFLNGGLFEPLPVEQRLEGLSWPDEVWTQVIEGLLERYRFAVEEMQGADEQRAVDPEMLGRVFEGLMFGSQRQRSGSFYTPRDIVRKLVDEALAGYLDEQTTLDSAQIKALIDAENTALSPALRREVLGALKSVKILDPAVGTGAFLLESLQVLRRLIAQVEEPNSIHHAAHVDDPLREYRQLRQLIHDQLFGVDIQSTAVRLCELRLWLALLNALPEVAISQMPPLPNLSHKVCVGNSLLSPMDHLKLRVGAHTFASAQDYFERPEQDGAPARTIRQLMDELRQAQQAYLLAHGPPKINARRELLALEEKLQRAFLSAREERLREKLAPLKTLRASRDLFGESVELNPAQASEMRHIQAELVAIKAAKEAIAEGRSAPLGFDYATRFGALLERGGFDIVITNPPWVRAQLIDAAQMPVLRAKYRSEKRKLWPGAQKNGIRAPFGPQVDLAALFIERSLELLRPGGRLCALVPAKLFSSLHGAALREYLAEHALVAIEDYSAGTRQLFDATVYPAMLHIKKREKLKSAPPEKAPKASRRPTHTPRAARPIRMTVWRGERADRWQIRPAALFAGAEEPGAPWLFAEPEILKIFKKMRQNSVDLGQIDALQPRRGLFSGCNDVFIGDEREHRDLLGQDFERFSCPVLSGRDIRPWSARSSRRILWAYDEQLNPREEIPASLREYFERRRAKLEGRSDFRPGRPIWQLFRVSEGLVKPKVVWRDLSPKLEAAIAPADTLPLNTVYFISCADDARARLLAALLNSAPMRAVAYALAERARGGWRRHFAWVIRLLPLPSSLVPLLSGEPAACAPLGARALLAEDLAQQAAPQIDALIAREFGITAAQLDSLSAWQQRREVA